MNRLCNGIISLLVLLTISACATAYDPDKHGVRDAQKRSSMGELSSTSGTTELTELIHKSDYFYSNKEFERVLELLNNYTSDTVEEELYLMNLKAHLYTYDSIDYSQAIELNEKLFQSVEPEEYLDTLQYSKDLKQTAFYFIYFSNLNF
jgi:hypothetical protein